MPDDQFTPIQLSPIFRAALVGRQPGEDIDEAILRALKAEHPQHAPALLSAVSELIDMEMQHAQEDREQVVQRLAAADPGPQVRMKSSDVGPVHFSFQSTTYRVGGKEYRSVEELPPGIRIAVQAALSSKRSATSEPAPPSLPSPSSPRRDDRRPIRMGCSTALLALLLRLFSH